MPHCIIECPERLNTVIDLNTLVKVVHDVTEDTGLFSAGDVKSRLITTNHFLVGGENDYFIHVSVHILSGRTLTQKKGLSDSLAKVLCELLPSIEMVSVEIRDIEIGSYSNRKSLPI